MNELPLTLSIVRKVNRKSGHTNIDLTVQGFPGQIDFQTFPKLDIKSYMYMYFKSIYSIGDLENFEGDQTPHPI